MKKKILLGAMFGVMTLSVMSFAKDVMAIWTSSCGVKHYTTFSDTATYEQIANKIAEINRLECGVTPQVSLNLN